MSRARVLARALLCLVVTFALGARPGAAAAEVSRPPTPPSP